jgi:hypothetical protein
VIAAIVSRRNLAADYFYRAFESLPHRLPMTPEYGAEKVKVKLQVFAVGPIGFRGRFETTRSGL